MVEWIGRLAVLKSVWSSNALRFRSIQQLLKITTIFFHGEAINKFLENEDFYRRTWVRNKTYTDRPIICIEPILHVIISYLQFSSLLWICRRILSGENRLNSIWNAETMFGEFGHRPHLTLHVLVLLEKKKFLEVLVS